MSSSVMPPNVNLCGTTANEMFFLHNNYKINCILTPLSLVTAKQKMTAHKTHN